MLSSRKPLVNLDAVSSLSYAVWPKLPWLTRIIILDHDFRSPSELSVPDAQCIYNRRTIVKISYKHLKLVHKPSASGTSGTSFRTNTGNQTNALSHFMQQQDAYIITYICEVCLEHKQGKLHLILPLCRSLQSSLIPNRTTQRYFRRDV